MLGLPVGGADEVDGIAVQSIDMYLSFDSSPVTECKTDSSVD